MPTLDARPERTEYDRRAVEPPTDEALLHLWRGGDVTAGNQLVRRHFDTVFRFFRGRFEIGAADLTQRTFLAAVQSRHRVPSSVSFKAYLLGIAHRQLLMALRTLRRHPEGPALDDSGARGNATSPSRVVARLQEQQLLLDALRDLPLELQLLVELYYWEELPIDQIAVVLEIRPGTVKSRLHRARRLLREAIAARAARADLRDSVVSDLELWARSLRLSPAPRGGG